MTRKKFKDFHLKIAKLKDFLSGNGIKVRKLNEEEIKEYIYRYISFSFEKGKFTFNNFSVSDNDIKNRWKTFALHFSYGCR